jgi:hypothetical protein
VTIEREYALKRYDRGVYLLVGNSERTAYLIRCYEEDGSAQTSDGRVIVGNRWRCYRLEDEVVVRNDDGKVVGGIALHHLLPDDPEPWTEHDVHHLIGALDWGRKGEVIADVLRTRREALETALTDDLRRNP